MDNNRNTQGNRGDTGRQQDSQRGGQDNTSGTGLNTGMDNDNRSSGNR